MRGKITISFSTSSILHVGDLTAAIGRLAPHIVDDVSITEEYVGEDDFVQWAIDNFEDLKVKHNRPAIGFNKVGLARVIKDERPSMSLKEVVGEINKHGQFADQAPR